MIGDRSDDAPDAPAPAGGPAADARGKQPFDLAALEALCDTSREGRIDPIDERRARFEEMYYIWFST
jgi:hypothetical protein